MTEDERQETIAWARAKVRKGLMLGVECGWFESFDEETLEPISFPKIFKKEDFGEKGLMAHVMHQAGIFTSVGEARRNGWNKPIECGDFTVTKKKIRIRIV